MERLAATPPRRADAPNGLIRRDEDTRKGVQRSKTDCGRRASGGPGSKMCYEKVGRGHHGTFARSEPACPRPTIRLRAAALAAVEVDAVPWVDAVSQIVVLH
jgi:hypothetical protein